MKKRLSDIISAMERYNSGDMAAECFGFDRNTEYGALVAAPSWKPEKIIKDPSVKITQLTQHSYFSGYLLEKDGIKIAWAQTGTGACNLIDQISICAGLKIHGLIFVGAVGSLTPEIDLGALCTPSESIIGPSCISCLDEHFPADFEYDTVLPDKAYSDFTVSLAASRGYDLKRAKVFCTDSISLEYSHLDEIKRTGAQLIEMETAAFYKLARLMDIPAAALLVVSDNSATGAPLLGRTEEHRMEFDRIRGVVIPDMVFSIAKS